VSRAGRKTKYDPDTFPLLAEGYFRDGLTDEQVSAKLGINPDTFYEYLKKYPDFSEAVKQGKRPVDIEVEKALLNRAIGFEYEEVKTEYLENHAEGKKSKDPKATKVTKTVKKVVGDVRAQQWWLKNRMRNKWRDRPPEEVSQAETDRIESEKLRSMFNTMTLEEKKQWLRDHQDRG